MIVNVLKKFKIHAEVPIKFKSVAINPLISVIIIILKNVNNAISKKFLQ